MPISPTEVLWKYLSSSVKWDREYDEGYKGSTLYPKWVAKAVINPTINVYTHQPEVFSIEELEWCEMHCSGKFARRYVESNSFLSRWYSSLGVMIFEKTEDANIFTVFLLAKKNVWFSEGKPVVSTTFGYIYQIPWLFSGIRAFTSDAVDIVTYIRNWCLNNCEGKYFLNTSHNVRFLLFEKEEDVIHFKLAVISLIQEWVDNNDS